MRVTTGLVALLLAGGVGAQPRDAGAPPPPGPVLELPAETDVATAPAEGLVTRARELMATRVTVTLHGAPPGVQERAFAEAFGAFTRVEAEMNEWRPESALSRINRHAGDGTWVPAPADLCEVLRQGLAGAARTQGLFDPTWAALRGLWRFGTDAEASPRIPTDAEVRARCARVGWRAVELRPDAADAGTGGACHVRLPREGMALGLGGLAKGWGVDRAVEALRALGLRDFVVQAGGDLYAAGTRGGRPWRVGVRDPRGPADAPFATLEVRDAAFSTSGDYERFFVKGGRRYHHLIDPRTCRPGRGVRQATVLAPTALQAEVLTKAVFLRGGRAGLALAEREGAGAVLVTADNRVLVSPALAPRLRRLHAPTR